MSPELVGMVFDLIGEYEKRAKQERCSSTFKSVILLHSTSPPLLILIVFSKGKIPLPFNVAGSLFTSEGSTALPCLSVKSGLN